MQSISFYQKINNNKSTSNFQLVKAISTIEASKDFINKKTYNNGHRRLKNTNGSGIKNIKKQSRTSFELNRKFFENERAKLPSRHKPLTMIKEKCKK